MDRKLAWGLIKDWGVALAIGVVVLFAWSWFQPRPVSKGQAPPIELSDLEGNTYSLADDASELVVVNFWATWCAPCRREIPDFTAFARDNPDVRVLGVSVDDMEPRALAAASKRLGIRYDVVHDPRQQTARRWGVNVYPTTFVLDAERHVVAMRVGTVDRARLDAMVDAARRHKH